VSRPGTLRVVLTLTPDEASDLHSATAVLLERRVAADERAQLNASVPAAAAVDSLRLAVRARLLHERVAAAVDKARKR
jgi:hypothetical protein